MCLKQDDFVKVDRRKGAVIAIDIDRYRILNELKIKLQMIVAKGSCKNISRKDIHCLIDENYENYGGLR